MKYQQKTVDEQPIVQAIKLTEENFDEVCKFIGGTPTFINNPDFKCDENGMPLNSHYLGVTIKGQDGRTENVYYGDFIMKADNNVCFACSAEKFANEFAFIAEDRIDRMKIEYFELDRRFQKLAIFVDGKMKEVVSDKIQRFLLVLQRELMGQYLTILGKRIWGYDAPDGNPQPYYIPRMNLGMAIEALKFGLPIKRKSWNGKDYVVIKQIPAHIEGDIIPKMQSLPQSAKDIIQAGTGFIDYSAQCLLYNKKTGVADSWVPTIGDVFAEDWEIAL